MVIAWYRLVDLGVKRLWHEELGAIKLGLLGMLGLKLEYA
jgi:hypothetical protein